MYTLFLMILTNVENYRSFFVESLKIFGLTRLNVKNVFLWMAESTKISKKTTSLKNGDLEYNVLLYKITLEFQKRNKNCVYLK